MKTFFKATKATLVSTCLLTVATFSSSSIADENLYHGTNCMTANLAQGELFSWNKDGLTNNFVNDLFVICPITMDQDLWDATPQLIVEVSIFMPPNYTHATGQIDGGGDPLGPQCIARFAEPNNIEPTDDQDFIANEAFNIGSFDGDAIDGDRDTDSVTLTVSNATDGNAHILCLIPEGGTIIRYSSEQI